MRADRAQDEGEQEGGQLRMRVSKRGRASNGQPNSRLLHLFIVVQLYLILVFKDLLVRNALQWDGVRATAT